MVPTADELRSIGLAAGLCAVGIASAEPFVETRAVLEQRKARGFHAGMQFTYRNPARSTDPRRTMTGATSLVVGALDFHRDLPERPSRGPHARVASYAWDDHYAALRSGLEAMALPLRGAGHDAIVVSDQNHLVDRAAAHRAGLGWWGKSSNLLVPGAGSLVVLGAVLTDAPLTWEPPPTVADGCGACTKCLDACPTGAIVAPGVVDARRCLAWLVQTSGVFPVEYRVALGDRIYGCDDCQDVCPPNQRRGRAPAEQGGPDAWVDLVELLGLADDELMARYGRWYVAERDPAHLRRNALVVLANVGDGTDPPTVAALVESLRHPDELVRAHAVWAARRLGRDDLLAEVEGGALVETELRRRSVPVA